MKVSKAHLPLDFDTPFWKDNFNDLKNYIKLSLGIPIVRAELHPFHYCLAIYNAIAEYVKLKEMTLHVADLSPDDNGFCELPDDIDGNKIESGLIRDVFFRTYGLQSNLEGYAYDEYLLWPGIYEPNLDSGITFDFVKYYMVKQNLEDFRITTGIDRTWEYLSGGIQLYPAGADHTDAKVLYGTFPTIEDIESEDFVRRWAVAEAQLILARNRNKFSGFAAPGGNATSDAADLRQEAQDTMTQLKESVTRPVVPIFHW